MIAISQELLYVAFELFEGGFFAPTMILKSFVVFVSVECFMSDLSAVPPLDYALIEQNVQWAVGPSRRYQINNPHYVYRPGDRRPWSYSEPEKTDQELRADHDRLVSYRRSMIAKLQSTKFGR